MNTEKEKAALAGAAQKNNLHRRSYQNPQRRQANCSVSREDYARLNQGALRQLPRLLHLAGVSYKQGRGEILLLNPHRIDRRFGSFSINSKNGRWADFAVHGVRGSDAVSLIAYLLQIRQGEAAQWIQRMLGAHHDR